MVLRENAILILMYLLGAALLFLLWWPLGLIYLVYCALSNFLYMARVCPYCGHYAAGTCPAGFDWLSGQRYKPREGLDFMSQFRRWSIALYPGWFLPPIIGTCLIFREWSWLALVLTVLFCGVGFIWLPVDSRRHCEKCDNLDCPRRRGKMKVVGVE